MNIFTEKHQKLLTALLKQGVKFLLVGGYAVIYHGYKRTTGDMDLWLEPNNDNKTKLLEVLSKFEFEKKGITHLKKLDFSKHLAFHFWEVPERVDCLTHISNVNFSEAYSQRVTVDVEGQLIPVIHYNHLIMSKITSDRLKDKADIEELQKVNSRKSKDK